MPLGQFMHASKPPPAYVPAAHVTEVAPSGHASPWGHGGGSIAPAAEQRLPAGHVAHAVWSPPQTQRTVAPVVRPWSMHVSKMAASTASPESMSHTKRLVETPSASTVTDGVHVVGFALSWPSCAK